MQTQTVPEVIKHTSTKEFVVSTIEIIIDPTQPPIYETMVFHNQDEVIQHRTTLQEKAFSVHLHYVQLFQKVEEVGSI